MTPSMRPAALLHRRAGRWQLLPLFLVALLAVSACSGFGARIGRAFGGKLDFAVELDSQLNQGFPVAVDFVVVYDRELLAAFGELTAHDWFEQRERLRLDHEPRSLEISSWELVPSCDGCAAPGPFSVRYRGGALGGVVFANYFTPGAHHILIEPLRPFALQLGESGFEHRPRLPPKPASDPGR